MNLFKFFSRFFAFFHLSIIEGEGGSDPEPSPTLNPRNAAMAQIAAAAHKSVEGDLANFDEDTGQIEATAPEKEPEEQKDPVVTDPEPEEQPKPRMASIVVDGQTIEVEESRLIEAGKRTLQKESAADKRLQDAERARREAETFLQQARSLAEQNPAPSQDAPTAQQATNGLDPEMLDTFLEQKLYVRDAQKARAIFEKEFPEIAADPDLWHIAAQREELRLKTAANLGEPYGDPLEAYRKHGEYIREKFKTAPKETVAVSQDKQERKRSITAVSALNARQPAPQDKKPLTTAEQIEQMRLARTKGARQATH